MGAGVGCLRSDAVSRIGYLGPPGTFTEQALRSFAGSSDAELVACDTIPDVLWSVQRGELDQGFVPIENAIEGTVNVAQDLLAFELDLLVRREVVIDIHLHLIGLAGARLADVEEVSSYPHALAQVRAYLRATLPEARVRAETSTAEAVAKVAAGGDPASAAIGNELAADLNGLVVLDRDVADHPGNQTRFVLVAGSGVPEPSGHDKTTLAVFQRADAPGSLLAILQEFAARRINLVKLESRPTRQGLGNYCFLVDLEGHVADEVVGDCLVQLRARHGDVRFLGSYPAAGDGADSSRDDAVEALRDARGWLAGVRRGEQPRR